MKKTNGITLIALIITIIVMMILVAVTIAIAIRGNIFSKAQVAAEKYKEESVKEHIALILASSIAEDTYLLEKDNHTIETVMNKHVMEDNKTVTVPSFEWTGRKDAIDVIYDGYICVIDKNNAKIITIKKINFELSTDDNLLSGKTIEQINREAKTVNYKFSSIGEGNNVVFNSDGEHINSNIHEGSEEQVWYVKEGEVKLAAEIYCADNVMIYDGTEPYVPVMVRFFRSSDYTSFINGKNRGLNYFKVETDTMEFTTNNENNDWAFVNKSEYNYTATSNRKCSSTANGGTSFNDRTNGHYYASGRLTYTETPTSILTDLGSFNATCADQDNNQFSFSIGSNYVIDVRNYYKAIEDGQSLINEVTENSINATQYHALSRAIMEAVNENYNYSVPGMFAYQLEQHTNEIIKAISDLNNAIGERPHISDEVLAVVRHAQETEIKIPTVEVNGGNNIFYTSDNAVINSYSDEQAWTNKVEQKTQAYCANNILLYDGSNSPYIPVMIKYYRQNHILHRNKSRGLNSFIVNEETMSFSTNNENGDWKFVTTEEYNYEAESERKCSGKTGGTASFNDTTAGEVWASGRLTYNQTPAQMLTDVGAFRATSIDQDGANPKVFSQGENYVVNVRGYYDKIEEAKALLTMENLYNNVNATYELALLINELRNIEYAYNHEKNIRENAQNLVDKIQDNINRINAKMF